MTNLLYQPRAEPNQRHHQETQGRKHRTRGAVSSGAEAGWSETVIEPDPAQATHNPPFWTR